VFMIDSLSNIEHNYLNGIVSLLNKGGKFVPCQHFNEYYIFRDLLSNFENAYPTINRSILFNLNKSLNPQNEQSPNNCLINTSNTCNILSCFTKKLKCARDPNTYPKLKESIAFKFHFYQELSKQKFSYKRNLLNSEMFYLHKFVKEKPFMVAECDKNVGISILSHDIYDELCNTHLNDTRTYKELYSSPLEETTNIIKSTLNDLLISKEIIQPLYDKLQVNNAKLGTFRILLKLHKDSLKIRPIINCKLHPTSNLCLLLDIILQPFVRESKSFIQDSQNLIQKTQNIKFDSNCKIYSCDFESLYTNINLNDALVVITEFISRKFKSTDIKIEAFHKFLKLVFFNNVFKYKNKYFIQISGIAMGSKCGPSIANIYISCLEDKFLTIHRPLLYYRFIDDILIITSSYFNIEILKTCFGYLVLNTILGKVVNFLDLNIKISTIDGSLLYSLYIKPTQTFTYLLISSNHPKHIYRNIPKSLFIRVRRICSSFIDYLYFSRLLISQLVLRGYNSLLLRKCARMVADLDRNTLIPYRVKPNIEFYNDIFCSISFNFNYLNIEQAFVASLDRVKSNNCLMNSKFKLLYFIPNNISALLIHNFKLNNFNKYSYRVCNRANCLTCIFSQPKCYYIDLNGFYLPLMSFSNCESINVIYILKCTLCVAYYIGQTKCLKRRITEHRRSCNVLKELTQNCICVHKHFIQNGHDYINHLRFYVFKCSIDNLNDRLAIEAQLINIFKALKCNIINDFIPYITNLNDIRIF
jgi:hypothetical protein